MNSCVTSNVYKCWVGVSTLGLVYAWQLIWWNLNITPKWRWPHPRKFIWNSTMEVCEMIFLFNCVISRFHVIFLGGLDVVEICFSRQSSCIYIHRWKLAWHSPWKSDDWKRILSFCDWVTLHFIGLLVVVENFRNLSTSRSIRCVNQQVKMVAQPQSPFSPFSEGKF